MDVAATRALERLRDPSGDAITELARLTVLETTATPLREIASPRWLASQLATAMEATTQGDLLGQWVTRRLEQERTRLHDEDRSVRSFLPPEAEEPLRRVIGRPYSPSEPLALRLIDQAAVNDLLGEILGHTISRFRERVAAWDGGIIQSVRDTANERSRGLMGGFRSPLNMRRNLGTLGGMAENLVGAVRDEVEASVESRVKEFVRGATRDAVQSIARQLASPERAEAFAELRLSLLDVVLDTPVSELAQEGDKLQPEDMVEIVVAALRSTVAAEDFVDRAEQRIALILDETGDGTLAAWLDEVGLADVWTTTTTELVATRLGAVVHQPAFDTWWEDLFR